jgi:XTP/dITP diphosphohydrolase
MVKLARTFSRRLAFTQESSIGLVFRRLTHTVISVRTIKQFIVSILARILGLLVAQPLFSERIWKSYGALSTDGIFAFRKVNQIPSRTPTKTVVRRNDLRVAPRDIFKEPFMKDTQITVVTGNKSKAAEIGKILQRDVCSVALDIPEIQSLDVVAVARAKAIIAFEQVGTAVIVDDTGLKIDALGGLPGALVSWFLDTVGPEGILHMVKGHINRKASVSTCVAYYDGQDLAAFEGIVEGRLAETIQGTAGFGYDPIFIPSGSTKTYAEMTPSEKNADSMRARALHQLSRYLSQPASG